MKVARAQGVRSFESLEGPEQVAHREACAGECEGRKKRSSGTSYSMVRFLGMRRMREVQEQGQS